MADKLYSSLLMDGRHEGLSCFTQVRTVYKLHSTDSAHDLLSPCMCPSLVHARVDIIAALTDVAICGLCAMTITSSYECATCSGSPHDAEAPS